MRPINIFDHISLSSLTMRNFSDKAVEKIRTYRVIQEESALLWEMIV